MERKRHPAAGYYFRTATQARVVPIEDVERVAGLVAAEPRLLVIGMNASIQDSYRATPVAP